MEELNISIGKKICKLRKEKGFSLSKLAEIAGISKSTLSAIESGESNPTISTLWAIANALNVPFGELIPDKYKTITESGISVQLIERSKGIEIYKMKLSPKSFRKAEPHQKGTIEHIFVIRGSVLAGEITNPKLIKAGESLEFRGDMPHLYMNIDEEETIAYVVIIFKREIDDKKL